VCVTRGFRVAGSMILKRATSTFAAFQGSARNKTPSRVLAKYGPQDLYPPRPVSGSCVAHSRDKRGRQKRFGHSTEWSGRFFRSHNDSAIQRPIAS
jgi:hypothetical protein